MLSIENVTKRYGKLTAVDNLSLELKSGVIGLIGHNGAGKTTLMQMIATLTRPTQGSIRFQGADVVKQPEAVRSRLGFLPQDFGVYPHLTAREFLSYFAALKGVADDGRIQHLLELVNLHEHADRLAAAFSGGMRQRLGIAQALLNNPDILIVDEPTAGLDPGERLRFRNLLSEIGFRKLVIVSTHIVSDIENMAGEIVVMKSGRLVAHATPDAILAQARGQIWEMRVDAPAYNELAVKKHVLQAQREGEQYLLRLVQSTPPSGNARAVEPSLEEALMTSQYLAQAA